MRPTLTPRPTQEDHHVHHRNEESSNDANNQTEKSELNGVILQAMGLEPGIAVALNRISLRRNDRFLVCSDGLSGPLTDEEMQNIITASPTLQVACAQLIEASRWSR